MASDRTALLVAGALSVLCGCHGGVEQVPLLDDLVTPRDRFFDVFTRTGDEVVVIGEGGKILRSDDAGERWVRAQTSVDAALMRIAFADRERGWVVGQGGVVLRTDDGGRTWSPQRSDTDRHLFGVAVASRDAVFACGDRSQWIRSEDGGEHWQGGSVALSDVGMDPDIALAVREPIYYDVTFLDDRTGWMVGDYGNIRFTTDGGRSWA
ncbi:MAG: WD40/YVTN/BNR-like repeat-containing protein, partial [Candidatus Binatia bacterium]